MRPIASRFDRRVTWIFGSPRSGSTWLLQLLRDHDRVVGINEPLIGLMLGPFVSDQLGVDPSRLDESNFTVRRIQRDKAMQFFAAEFQDAWAPRLGALMRARFRAHVSRYPPAVGRRRAVVVVKEPNGSQSADVLTQAMPDSRLLFLLRDGRDVVDSQLAAVAAGSWLAREHGFVEGVGDDRRMEFLQQSARKWLWRTAVVQEAFARHPGPKLLLRYEDLRSDPLRHLPDVMRLIGLEPDARWIEQVVEATRFESIPEDARGASSFFRAATPGLWRENLSPAEQGALQAILGPKLEELGYRARAERR